jgi:hypothetical protein
MPWLEEKYIKPGKVRYFVRDFPLEAIHPQAQRWAEATHCAAEAGRYWELRTDMFMLEGEGSLSALLGVSVRSTDRLEVERCLEVARYASRVQEDVREGRRLGIAGTPEFLVGYLDPDHPGELRGMRRLSGIVLFAEFERAIESVLAGESQQLGHGEPSPKTLENRLMPEAGLPFIGGPVPVVRADDLKRVWSFLAETARDSKGQGVTTGVDIKLLAGLCDKDADVLAVWFRATLITALLKQRRLDRWREGDSLRARVFELAASFPLPQGVEHADYNGFIAAIE